MEEFVFHLQAFFFEMRISFHIVLSDCVFPFQKEAAWKIWRFFIPSPPIIIKIGQYLIWD